MVPIGSGGDWPGSSQHVPQPTLIPAVCVPEHFTEVDDFDTVNFTPKQKQKKNTSGLKLVSVNGNSWATINRCQIITSASVACVQEHKLTKLDIVEAKLWARRNG